MDKLYLLPCFGFVAHYKYHVFISRSHYLFVLFQGLRVKPLDDHVDGVKEPSFSRVFGGKGPPRIVVNGTVDGNQKSGINSPVEVGSLSDYPQYLRLV